MNSTKCHSIAFAKALFCGFFSHHQGDRNNSPSRTRGLGKWHRHHHSLECDGAASGDGVFFDTNRKRSLHEETSPKGPVVLAVGEEA